MKDGEIIKGVIHYLYYPCTSGPRPHHPLPVDLLQQGWTRCLAAARAPHGTGLQMPTPGSPPLWWPVQRERAPHDLPAWLGEGAGRDAHLRRTVVLTERRGAEAGVCVACSPGPSLWARLHCPAPGTHTSPVRPALPVFLRTTGSGLQESTAPGLGPSLHRQGMLSTNQLWWLPCCCGESHVTRSGPRR